MIETRGSERFGDLSEITQPVSSSNYIPVRFLGSIFHGLLAVLHRLGTGIDGKRCVSGAEGNRR